MIVFTDEARSDGAWNGRGTWSGAEAVSRNRSDAWSADIATMEARPTEPLESLVRDRPPTGPAPINLVRDSSPRTPFARSVNICVFDDQTQGNVQISGKALDEMEESLISTSHMCEKLEENKDQVVLWE